MKVVQGGVDLQGEALWWGEGGGGGSCWTTGTSGGHGVLTVLELEGGSGDLMAPPPRLMIP